MIEVRDDAVAEILYFSHRCNRSVDRALTEGSRLRDDNYVAENAETGSRIFTDAHPPVCRRIVEGKIEESSE